MVTGKKHHYTLVRNPLYFYLLNAESFYFAISAIMLAGCSARSMLFTRDSIMAVKQIIGKILYRLIAKNMPLPDSSYLFSVIGYMVFAICLTHFLQHSYPIVLG